MTRHYPLFRMPIGRAWAAHGLARGCPTAYQAGQAGSIAAKMLPSPHPLTKWAAHGPPAGP
ncbi:hypothetical protein PCASD_17580 [Puccinia coronata f. sp. avenae]|uniref:Uncharacterized protein n=1 Tax=Puccinia coronata f. sp. avenae TaxID=200324 RepID=A0A2N5T6Z0_9BASI|nr:hypothetical protein PCASD_17580 [Puccinia coronata f. sp. avenae]